MIGGHIGARPDLLRGAWLVGSRPEWVAGVKTERQKYGRTEIEAADAYVCPLCQDGSEPQTVFVEQEIYQSHHQKAVFVVIRPDRVEGDDYFLERVFYIL